MAIDCRFVVTAVGIAFLSLFAAVVAWLIWGTANRETGRRRAMSRSRAPGEAEASCKAQICDLIARLADAGHRLASEARPSLERCSS